MYAIRSYYEKRFWMLFKNRLVYIISVILSVLSIIFFIGIIYKSFFIVKNQFIDIGGLTYVNQVKTDEYTKALANRLSKGCKTQVCEVQSMLDLVTNIPYKVNESVARSGKNVIEQNYGDCDDKSNLLISLLHVITSYSIHYTKLYEIISRLK